MTLPDRPSRDDYQTWVRAAFRQDIPPRGAKQTTLAALGLGAATVSSIGLATTPTSAMLTPPKLVAVIWIKWMGAGALAATIAVGAHHVATQASALPATAPNGAAAERTTPAKTPRAVRIVSPAATAVIEPPTAPVVVSARSRPGPSSALETAAVESPGAGTVHDEVAAVERARTMLLGGDVAAALDAIAAYDRAFPAGILEREARVLEIEAYAKQGDRTRAVRLAKAYLSTHPADAHTRRLENIVDQEEEP